MTHEPLIKQNKNYKVNTLRPNENDNSQDRTLIESLILAQDKRWRRA